MNFKFGAHAPRENPFMIPENFSSKGACLGSCKALKFWVVNAKSSKMAKAIAMHACTESADMTPEKIFQQGAWLGSRHPSKFWAINADSSKFAKDMNLKFGRHGRSVSTT